MHLQHRLAAAIVFVLAAGSANATSFNKLDRTITRDQPSVSTQAPSFVGQRLIVRTRGSADAGRVALTQALSSSVQRAGLERSYVATSSAAARPAASARVLRSMAAPGWHVVQMSRLLSESEMSGFMRELQADPSVEKVEIDQLYQRADVASTHLALPLESKAAAPNDPNYATLQWNFHNATSGVQAEQAWGLATGKGVVVAVVDTGIVKDSMDLSKNVLPGYDMITDKRVSRRASDGRVAGGWDQGDWVEKDYCTALGAPSHEAEDSSWHGSHVSGTIAQETNNGVGVAGLAHDAKIVPVRVLGSCGGFGSDIADGILWAAGATVEGMPVNPNPAEVINMSLGSNSPVSCPDYYQDAIKQANKLGSIIVVAAGNSNADAGTYTMPACDGVITVGATRITGGKANYSNWGPKVDIAAPGGGGSIDGEPSGYIYQVLNAGTKGPSSEYTLAGFTGTSMATPHVTAAVALVQSVVKTPLTWEQMRDLLKTSARPFPASIPVATPIGSGILDAYKLLQNATKPPCDPKKENCTPETTLIKNRVELHGLSTASTDALYRFEAEAGKPLTLMSYGGTGNVSMYVAQGKIPTSTEFTAKSTRAGNTEIVTINAPVKGTYYVRLSGAYGQLSFVARQ